MQGLTRESGLVDRWKADSYTLIAAATDYVSKGEPDESASANIREIRVVVAALQAAVQQTAMMPTVITMPEPPQANPGPPQFVPPTKPPETDPPPPLPPAA